MEPMDCAACGRGGLLPVTEAVEPKPGEPEVSAACAELKRGVYAALETYSNVHRGSGHNSLISTQLYEQARDIVLEYLRLDKAQHAVIFCTPRRAELLGAQLAPESYRSVSTRDLGLSLGVRALAVRRNALPRGVPFQTGGGTARLVSAGSVIWARPPDRFEAGTPAIVNVIAFARSIRLIQHFGPDAFRGAACAPVTAASEILHHDELEPYSGQDLLDRLRQTLIGRSVRVPTVEGERPYINLDNAASTPTFEPVWEAVWQAWHQPAQVREEIIHEVRSICAEFLGAPQADYDLIFTSNATEAINLVAESLRNASAPGATASSAPAVAPVVLNTFLEHNSNELPWRTVPGCALIRLHVDDEGFFDLCELEELLCAYNEVAGGQDRRQAGIHSGQRIVLVAVSGASNVLGTFNDLAEVSRIVHRHGAHLLVDAAQLVAHRPVDIAGWGIDYFAFSAHKAYAPFGTGVLLARKGLLNFSPAEREGIRSSGEENVGGIAALGKALVLLQRIGLDIVRQEEQALTERALLGMAQIPGLRLYGVKNPDSTRFAQRGGVIAFDLGDMMPGRVARELAARGGIGVRYGCHCAHLLIKRVLHIPPLLQQLQGLILTLFPRVTLPGVVRVSLGIENSAEDVEALLHVLDQIVRQPRAKVGKGAVVWQQMDDFAKAAVQRVYARTQ